MRLIDHEKRCKKILQKAHVDSPELCARILTSHASGLDKIEYILAWDKELTPSQAIYLNNILHRRAAGEPLAYILEKKEFYGREFKVSKATLIPRPETELLIDISLHLLPQKHILFADLGCGSGCIGLTLMVERVGWQGVMTDNNSDVLHIAKQNASLFNKKPIFILNDFFQPAFSKNLFNLIIANPPYISKNEIADIMRETWDFEPHFALLSNQNGLDHLEAVIKIAKNALLKNGWVVLEHGASQGHKVTTLLQKHGFTNIQDLKDLAGLPRCAIGQKQGDTYGHNKRLRSL